MKVKGYIYTLCALSFACVLNCGCDKEPVLTREAETVTYRPSKTNFCNPERGYYSQYTVRFSGGEINTERASVMLLDEYRGGKLGKITMEFPPLTDLLP